MSVKFLAKQSPFDVYRVVTEILPLHLRMLVSSLTSSQPGVGKFGEVLLWTFLIQRVFAFPISSGVNGPISLVAVCCLAKELFRNLSAQAITHRVFQYLFLSNRASHSGLCSLAWRFFSLIGLCSLLTSLLHSKSG